MFEIPNPYAGNYRLLAIAPIVLLIAALFFIPQIHLGVEFKGGTLITIATNQENVDEAAAVSTLKREGVEVSSFKVYKSPAAAYKNIVEIEVARSREQLEADRLRGEFFANVDEVSRLQADYQQNRSNAEKYPQAVAGLQKTADGIFALSGSNLKAENIENINVLRREVAASLALFNGEQKEELLASVSSVVKYDAISIEEISASLSSKFIEKVGGVVIISAILVIAVVFLVYRTFIPSFAVLAGAGTDILIALGAMGFFGIPLTLASFAALLMLVGFALDTSILLTMRVIKRREGTAAERAFDATKTGFTMGLAAIVAFSSLYVLSYVTHIGVYYEISAVALCGLVADMFATWGINAVIVLDYAKKKERDGQVHEEKPIFTGIFSN